MKRIYLLLTVVLMKTNLKAQFKPSSYPENIITLNIICFYSDKILLMNAVPNFLFSKDGGKNFTKTVSPGNYNNAVTKNDSTYIASFYNQIKQTKDRGSSWIMNYLITDFGDTLKNQDMFDFNIFKNGKGFITNYPYNEKPQVYVTKNWGDTWNLLDYNKNKFTPRDYKGNSYTRKQFNFDSTVYAMKQSSDSILIKYANYGDSVFEINLAEKGIIQKVYQIAFKDENNGIITTSFSKTELQKIYITTDGCKTFTEIKKPTENFQKIEYAKSTKNKESFYIATFLTTLTDWIGGTYFTKDDGKTWYKNLDNNYLFSMDFYDAETGIVTIGKDIGNNTNIFYFTDLMNGVNEKSKVNGINIYPNPTSKTLNINGITEKSIVSGINIYPNPTSKTLNINGIDKNINYSIFNLQGQSILKGNTNISIDVSSLQQGLYILNLETENGVLVNKFIKE